jgi:hypothetical protein
MRVSTFPSFPQMQKPCKNAAQTLPLRGKRDVP